MSGAPSIEEQDIEASAGCQTESWHGLDRSKLCAKADRRADRCTSLVGPAGLKAEGRDDAEGAAAVFGLMYLLADKSHERTDIGIVAFLCFLEQVHTNTDTLNMLLLCCKSVNKACFVRFKGETNKWTVVVIPLGGKAIVYF